MNLMKTPLFGSLLALLVVGFAPDAGAQQFMTREGHVHFFSSTPIEDIEADNRQMSGLLDASTGDFAFQVQMRAFHFEKALMEEHFNENYVESETHPKATFQGSIASWGNIPNDGQRHDVVAEGEFDIHGVTQPHRIEGTVQWVDGAWKLQANFKVTLADHNIVIPAVVKDNISPVIAVDVEAQLLPR